jgi:hypothetical protein
MTPKPDAQFDLPGIAVPTSQEPARRIVSDALPQQLARGLVVIQYRTENLRIVPVYGPAALSVIPHIGRLHVTVDGHRGTDLPPGPRSVLIELADATHRVLDSETVSFEVPPRHE